MNNQYRMLAIFAVLLALTQQWLLVSDLHVNPFASPSAPLYKHDSNWALFDSTLSQMRRAAPGARVVIIAGDFLAHSFEAKVREHEPGTDASTAALATMSRIASAFDRAFPHAQFLITLGNNDDPCGDYRAEMDSRYLAALARIWAPLVDRNGASPGFAASFAHDGSYQARLPVNGLRAVAVDDVFWSIVYRPCGNGRDAPALQMQWLQRAFRSAPHGSRFIVLMHIPPGVDPISTELAHRFVVVPYLSDAMRIRMLRLLAGNATRIPFAIAGHMHRSGFRVAGGVPMLVAPAISPVYQNNPAFLRLDVGSTGKMLGYTMFAYDLVQKTWSPVFTFSRAYGQRSFTSPALEAAHREIAGNAATRARWASGMVGGAAVASDVLGAWRVYWCAQVHFGSGFAGCAGVQRRAIVLPIALALLALLIAFGAIALVLRLARQRRPR